MIVINEADGSMLNIVDIINKQLPSNIKKINHFMEFGGIVYVSCDFGIVQFNLATMLFGDTYFIGNNGAEISVTQTAVFNGFIYAATIDGVRKADITNKNLIDFNQWTQIAAGSWSSIEAFGTELTQQELWNDMPSEEKYDVQIKMLDDGNEMIGLAKMMFGGTDINVYGPELFRFIQNMPDTPDNKKVILTASFIGELRNELDRSKSGSIRPLYNAVNLYYRNYMHVTAKRLAAGRILRLFTDN